MSKKSLIAVIIIVVVVAAGGWWFMASAKHQTSVAPVQQTAAANINQNTEPATVNTARQNTTAKNDQNKVSAPAAASSASANSLIGTWISSVKDKGMQGSGQVVLPKFTTKFEMSSDVKLVVKTVADNIASGMLSYSNLCTVSTITMPGKPGTTKPAECVNGESKAVELHINGNALTFAGQTSTGGNISFTGNYTDNTMSGTFTITGSYGDMKGTFSLDRAKN
jgi:Flagellar basal body-associated protein FliL.